MSAEDRLRYEINKCRNCEACRFLVSFSCLVFPEIFRLVDKERETGEEITTRELIDLVNLCTFCGACPCLDIRAAIMEAKTEYMDKHGLSFKIQAIEDVERIGKLGGAIPALTNFLLRSDLARGVIEKRVGIHRDRKIPAFPKKNFPEWIKRRSRKIRSGAGEKRKVAYFAGCTARYLFPDVARAVVEVFERNGIEVYYPDQRCCGMPSLLEGDRKLTLEFARFNVDILAQAIKQGYNIVCSCPTCGYMLKNVLKIGAQYAPECREPLESVNGIVSIPIHGFMSSQYNQFFPMHAQLYEAILRDEGYFSSIDPQKRIIVAENSYDVGEYLMDLHKEGQFNTRLGHISVKATYYPPCHLREQKIGRPYEYLMSLIPELYLDVIDGNYCCGNGGIMGFKKEFYHSSIKIASRLLSKIKALNPDVLTTDCLSCRLQFNQLTSYKVLHPIEVIREAYINNEGQDKKKAV